MIIKLSPAIVKVMSLEEPYCHDMNPIGHIDQIGSWFVLKKHNLAVAIIENNLLTMLKEDEYRIISTAEIQQLKQYLSKDSKAHTMKYLKQTIQPLGQNKPTPLATAITAAMGVQPPHFPDYIEPPKKVGSIKKVGHYLILERIDGKTIVIKPTSVTLDGGKGQKLLLEPCEVTALSNKLDNSKNDVWLIQIETIMELTIPPYDDQAIQTKAAAERIFGKQLAWINEPTPKRENHTTHYNNVIITTKDGYIIVSINEKYTCKNSKD